MRIGFAGAFGHRPNLEGLHWFLDEIWPRIRSRLPAAIFVIAGRNPPPALLARQDEAVAFAGFVPDIFEFYAANTVTVVPLVSGGGVKIKTVEAMLAGSAVVATQIGAEGTGLTAGREALVEDDPTAFADAVVRILLDADLRGRLADAARTHAAKGFSAQAWRTCVDTVFANVVKQHADA